MSRTRKPAMLTRRSALKTMGAAAAVTLAAPNIARAKPSQLVVATGGGKLDDAYKASVHGFVARPNVTNLDHFGHGFRNIWIET